MYRLVGGGMYDVRDLTMARTWGFPSDQWMNILANADSRIIALKQMHERKSGVSHWEQVVSWEQLHEIAFTTLHVESFFSFMASAVLGGAGGKKPTAQAVQQRLAALDVAYLIKHDTTRLESFTVMFSRRMRKDIAGASAEMGQRWATEVEGYVEQWLEPLAKRCKTYTSNRAGTNRHQSQKRGGLLSGGW